MKTRWRGAANLGRSRLLGLVRRPEPAKSRLRAKLPALQGHLQRTPPSRLIGIGELAQPSEFLALARGIVFTAQLGVGGG